MSSRARGRKHNDRDRRGWRWLWCTIWSVDSARGNYLSARLPHEPAMMTGRDDHSVNRINFCYASVNPDLETVQLANKSDSTLRLTGCTGGCKHSDRRQRSGRWCWCWRFYRWPWRRLWCRCGARFVSFYMGFMEITGELLFHLCHLHGVPRQFDAVQIFEYLLFLLTQDARRDDVLLRDRDLFGLSWRRAKPNQR